MDSTEMDGINAILALDCSLVAGDFHQEVVGHYRNGGVMVDTSTVPDGFLPYETGVEHPAYHGGAMIIVGAYATREEALAGQHTWVERLTQGELPETIEAKANCALAIMAGTEGRVFDRE